MAIDWEKGEITREQHYLRRDQLHPTILEMPLYSVAYTDIESLRAGKEGALWVDPADLIYDEESRHQHDYLAFYRLIKLQQGYILDVSMDPPNREERTGIRHEVDLDLEKAGWLPVVGLLETPEQVKEFERLMWHDHGIALMMDVTHPYAAADSED